MPWVKIDSDFWTHPKVLKAGEKLAVKHQRAMCWSTAHATGGRVPRYALPELRMTRGDVDKLLAVRLWDAIPGDQDAWQIHDWHVYNPDAEQAKERRDGWEVQRLRWRDEKRQQRARKRTTTPDMSADSPEDDPEDKRGQVRQNVACDVDAGSSRSVSSRHASDSERDETRASATPSPALGAQAPPTQGTTPHVQAAENAIYGDRQSELAAFHHHAAGILGHLRNHNHNGRPDLTVIPGGDQCGS